MLGAVVWEKRAAWVEARGPLGSQWSSQKEVEAPLWILTLVIDRKVGSSSVIIRHKKPAGALLVVSTGLED
jgi:hypothetical protein